MAALLMKLLEENPAEYKFQQTDTVRSSRCPNLGEEQHRP